MLGCFAAFGDGEDMSISWVEAHAPLTLPLLQLSEIFLQSFVVVCCHYEVVEDGIISKKMGLRCHPTGQIINEPSLIKSALLVTSIF